jgi:hypothetical protein
MMGFSLGRTWTPRDLIGSRVDVLAHCRRNNWRGREEAQIQATILRPAVERIHAEAEEI